MGISKETLVIFTFLIPGFLSSALLNSLVVRREKDALARIIEALVFSFIIYALATLVTGQSPVLPDDPKEGTVPAPWVPGSSGYLVTVLLLALALPLGIGLLITTDWHMWLLRTCRVTDKTSRENIWLDVFIDQKRPVIVHFTNGRRLHGWPLYYSDDAKEAALYLYDPAWFVPERNDWVRLNVHGLFLVKRDVIDWIEFLPMPGEAQPPATPKGDSCNGQATPGAGKEGV